MNLTLGFSPCPNDTFLFDALIHDRIPHPGVEFSVQLDDVEALNQMAFEGVLDITKLSYHAFAHLTEKYQMLLSGSALGEGVGPLLIVNGPIPTKPESEWRVAVPGEYTTANLLLQLAYPEIQNKHYMLFSDIEEALIRKEYDAGVIIHENRFTYMNKGLGLVADLGDHWEKTQQLPIPLGGIAIRRSLPEDLKERIQKWIQASTAYAFKYPMHSLPFVKDHAQAMDADIMKKHIELYVNPYTLDLGTRGILAVDRMLNILQEQGAISKVFHPWHV